MEQLIGNKVYVSLKDKDETLSGLLIHVEEHYVYVQMDSNVNFYVIPKSNVSYYVSDRLPTTSRILPGISRVAEVEPEMPQAPSAPRALEVYINSDLITAIPVSANFDFNKFSDDTMKAVLGNANVQSILAGRRQKSLEYSPGKVYITTVSEDEEQVPEDAHPDSTTPNSFSMGSTASEFKTGPEMVSIINNSVKRGKQT